MGLPTRDPLGYAVLAVKILSTSHTEVNQSLVTKTEEQVLLLVYNEF